MTNSDLGAADPSFETFTDSERKEIEERYLELLAELRASDDGVPSHQRLERRVSRSATPITPTLNIARQVRPWTIVSAAAAAIAFCFLYTFLQTVCKL